MPRKAPKPLRHAQHTDVTLFVREQHDILRRDGTSALLTPAEHVYPVVGPNQLGVDVP